MLKILEISTEDILNEHRENRDDSYDYLYILKYNGQMILCDNGNEINLNDFYSKLEVNNLISNSIPTSLSQLTSDSTHRLVTDEQIVEWNSKTENSNTFSGSYNDLTDKPTIPTVTNDLTDELKASYDQAVIDGHTHSNKDTLDKLSTSDNGNLLFDNNEIGSGGSSGGTNVSVSQTITSGTQIGTVNGIALYAPTHYDNVYSTTETVVGTWLDKPLYRKVIQTTMPTATSTVYVSTGTTITYGYIKECIKIGNSGTASSNDTGLLVTNTGAVYGAVQLMFNSNSSHPNTILIYNSYSSWNGFSLYITIEYTKS